MKPDRLLYSLAVVLIPVSFGVKEMFSLRYWLDPTLLLAIILFLLWRSRPRPQVTIAVVAFSLVSAYAGTIYMPPLYSDLITIYRILKEPLRLFLVMAFFWVSLRLLVEDRRFVLRWIAVSVLVQLALGSYLILAVLGKAPYPDFLDRFVEMHSVAQWTTVGGFFVPRMCGTFFESPPFGEFTFSALLVLALGYLRDGVRTRLVFWGILAAAVGVIASLSEQVLLGFLPCVAGVVLVAKSGRKLLRLAFVVVCLMMIPYVSKGLMQRVQQSKLVLDPRSTSPIVGLSGGERIYHAHYALRTLEENPWSWLTGLGPGRYGEYASQTLLFPDTVTPQVTPIAWLFGYGVTGTLLILAWLFLVGSNAVKAYGLTLGVSALAGILLANMFQAGWKSESFFLALAYLYASAYFKRRVPGGRKAENVSVRKAPTTPVTSVVPGRLATTIRPKTFIVIALAFAFAARADGASTARSMLSPSSGNDTITRADPARSTLVYNVKDFGAKGDGKTDDTAAIQAAIRAAQASGSWKVGDTGGIVFFPQGQYEVSSTITTAPGRNSNGSVLWGAGAQATRVDCRMKRGVCLDISDSALWGFSPGLRGIDLEGPGSASSTTCVALGSRSFSSWGLRFSGFRIANCGIALRFAGGNEGFCTFDNFVIQDNRQAIVVASGLQNFGENNSFFDGVIANGSLNNDVYLTTGPLGEFNFYSVSFDSVQITVTNGVQFRCFSCHFEDPSIRTDYSPWLRITGTNTFSMISLDDCTFVEDLKNYQGAKIAASSGLVSLHHLFYQAATFSTKNFVILTGSGSLEADHAPIFYAFHWAAKTGTGSVTLPRTKAVTMPIGGLVVRSGDCASGHAHVAGASDAIANGATIRVTPKTFPGKGFDWNRAYLSAENTVTVQICNTTSGPLIPTPSIYNIAVQ